MIPAADPTGAPLVLVVDDELPIQKMLGILLRANGLCAAHAMTGAEAVARAAESNPALILLDLGLPDIDGIELTRRLRDRVSAPILVISARSREQDTVEVLGAGASDYLTKPFANGELLARIRMWLREAAGVAAEGEAHSLETGELRVDFGRRLVWVAGREVHLTPIEYELFATLMRNPGRVLTHQQLLDAAWGQGHRRDLTNLRVCMGQLRRKLRPTDVLSRYILTEPGVGYRLKVD